MMMQQISYAQPANRRGSDILINLMNDTDASVLAMLSTRFGLRRVPGLNKDAIVERLLRYLSDERLLALQNELIAARYADLSIRQLLRLVIDGPSREEGATKARLDQIVEGDASLLESGDRRWKYTMRGHDVTLDLNKHELSCGCQFFAFASKRKTLCKHLALGMTLIPPAYAREALIDLIVMRKFGDRRQPQWSFESQAA